jgi:hypothetical protein
VRWFALATILVAIFSTQGAAQDAGMPANCAQDLDKCSEKIWAHDTFPHAGVTQSVTFNNGLVLTCTSMGRGRPRDCTLEPGRTTTNSSNGIPVYPPQRQCADLKGQLRGLTRRRDAFQALFDGERGYLARVAQTTPAMLDDQIRQLQDAINGENGNPYDPDVRRKLNIERHELDFLMGLRNNQALGDVLGPGAGKTSDQMQAKANRIISDQQSADADQQRSYDKEIQDTQDQIAKLNCDNVPSVDQSVPRGGP